MRMSQAEEGVRRMGTSCTPVRHREGPTLVAVGLALGLLVVGCGASSGGRPGRAQIGKQAIAFSVCMRSHGVPNFPDPVISSSGGGVQVRIGGTGPGSLDPRSPAFQSAQQACQKLLPGGGPPGGALSAQDRVQGVKFADCMRAHGVPDFPDPTQDGVFHLPGSIGQQGPQFQSATRACMSLQPHQLAFQQGSGP